ncbi:hypothetical protein CRUP_025442 [Coryphaenoides rupestris]|nr:hypothetical protein CRUP_025442 [Coryphaenoides rupestris]
MSDAAEFPQKEEKEDCTPEEEQEDQSEDSSEDEACGATEMDFLRNLFSNTLGLGSREKVLDELTLDSVARYILSGKCKNIICMVGAGISTSAGIPDFRSPGTGLYANLQKYQLPYPEAIFQIDYFKKHPEPFFALARELYPGQFKPTVCHYFMKMLKDKGLLRRCYSQAHGTFYTSHCVSFSCRKEYNLDWMKEKIFSDAIPKCDKCSNIVFFGESLPVRFFTSMKMDFPQCDLLIVMGTSLQVQPFAGLVGRDVAHISTCDEGCLALADLLGWKGELEALVSREYARIDSQDKQEKAGVDQAATGEATATPEAKKEE